MPMLISLRIVCQWTEVTFLCPCLFLYVLFVSGQKSLFYANAYFSTYCLSVDRSHFFMPMLISLRIVCQWTEVTFLCQCIFLYVLFVSGQKSLFYANAYFSTYCLSVDRSHFFMPMLISLRIVCQWTEVTFLCQCLFLYVLFVSGQKSLFYASAYFSTYCLSVDRRRAKCGDPCIKIIQCTLYIILGQCLICFLRYKMFTATSIWHLY